MKAVNDAGGKAIGISADSSDRASLDAAFETIAKELPDYKLAAAIYNASAGLRPTPFVEVDPEVLETSINVNMYVILIFVLFSTPSTVCHLISSFIPPIHIYHTPLVSPSLSLFTVHCNRLTHTPTVTPPPLTNPPLLSSRGFFNFAQKTLPLLEASVASSPHPPTLIVTGATASVKGSARFATFAAGKWGKRALAQSIAREYGPKGVHVAHAIIDGVITGPRTEAYANVNGGAPDGKISADSVSISPSCSFTCASPPFLSALELPVCCEGP